MTTPHGQSGRTCARKNGARALFDTERDSIHFFGFIFEISIWAVLTKVYQMFFAHTLFTFGTFPGEIICLPEFSFWYNFLKKQWIFMCSTTTRGNLDKGKSGLSNQTNWNNYERGFKICKNKDFSCSQSKVSNRRHIKGRAANRRPS